jgi:hypothetical protein
MTSSKVWCNSHIRRWRGPLRLHFDGLSDAHHGRPRGDLCDQGAGLRGCHTGADRQRPRSRSGCDGEGRGGSRAHQAARHRHPLEHAAENVEKLIISRHRVFDINRDRHSDILFRCADIFGGVEVIAIIIYRLGCLFKSVWCLKTFTHTIFFTHTITSQSVPIMRAK